MGVYPAGSLVQLTGTVTEFNVGAATNALTAANPLTELTAPTAISGLSMHRNGSAYGANAPKR